MERYGIFVSTLKIDLAPGCGRKLSTSRIRGERKRLSELGVLGSGPEWVDAVPLANRPELLMSIDTSVRSQSTTKDFFRLAFLHAMRDLHASFTNPTDFSASVRFDDSNLEHELREFSQSLSDIQSSTRAKVGKLHSFLGVGPTEVTVSVVGERLRELQLVQDNKYDLFMLGEIYTGTGDDERDWRLLLSHGELIAKSKEITLAKDISGDGLAGALVQISEDRNWIISLHLQDVPHSDTTVPLDDCNLDRNLADFEQTIKASNPLTKLDRAILMKPQFCGAFLAVLPQNDDNGYLRNQGFVKIGACRAGAARIEVLN